MVPLSSGFAVRSLRKNSRWGGSLRNQEVIAESDVLYTIEGNQLRFVVSQRTEQVVDEVTKGLRLTGTGRPNRRLAVLSLLNACFEACFNEPTDGGVVGVLWPTSTSEEKESRYKRKLFSPPAKRKAAENLEEHGYIRFFKGGRDAKSFEPGRVSLVIPTVKLQRVYDEVIDAVYNVEEPSVESRELVILEDQAGMRLDYQDTDFTKSIRSQLRAINQINKSHSWAFEHKRSGLVEINPSSLALTRLFKRGSFSIYGRYHSDVQGLRKAERRRMLIDNEDTVELDFSSMLPTLAYAQCGLDSAEITAWEYDGDPYELAGFTRALVKKGLLTCLNAENREAARKSLSNSGQFDDSKSLSLFIDSLIMKHLPIAPLFFSGAWQTLCIRESEVMSIILTHCINFNRPVLAIHDGLVCRVVDKDLCRGFMLDAFEQKYGFTPKIKLVTDAAGIEVEA